MFEVRELPNEEGGPRIAKQSRRAAAAARSEVREQAAMSGGDADRRRSMEVSFPEVLLEVEVEAG